MILHGNIGQIFFFYKCGANIFFFYNFFYVSLAAALKAGHRGVGLQLHIAEKIILGHFLNDVICAHSFSC